jgi:hypothetical protein
MPVGLGGAAFMRNLPQAGGYTVNDEFFQRETERNDVPLAPITYTGLGGASMQARIPNNGLLTGINLLFVGSLVTTTATGTVVSGYQWPWNVLKKVTLNANGQTSLISAEGMDLRVRRQRLYRNPREELSSAVGTDTVGTVQQTGAVGNPLPGTIAAGTYAITLEWSIPIVHDDESLVGALYAQSDQNYLTFTMVPAQATDLFAITGTATAALTGTIYPTVTFFDIPIAGNGQQNSVVIPNLAWLHGYLSADNQYSNTGTVKTPFIRTDGQLLSFCFYLDNGGAAQIAPTTLNEVRFVYGGNRKPRVFNPVLQLLSKNVKDYNGLLKPGYMAFDFEIDNPARDLVYPKGVSELAVEVEIPTGTTINANARIHFVEETLFSGM